MGTTLNRHAYQHLIDEDLAWLEAQERTLEQQHIIEIVRQSPSREYGKSSSEDAGHALLPVGVEKVIQVADAPERIWIEPGSLGYHSSFYYAEPLCEGGIEYVRADLAVAPLPDDLETARAIIVQVVDDGYLTTRLRLEDAIAAALTQVRNAPLPDEQEHNNAW